MSSLAQCMKETHLALPPNVGYEEWADMAHALSKVERNIMWWLGDWILYGETHYDEEAYQAIVGDIYAQATVKVARWVCLAFPPEDRREALTFHHHKVVAGQPDDTRKWLLDWAEKEGASVHTLRLKLNPELKPIEDAALGPYEADRADSCAVPPHQLIGQSRAQVGRLWTAGLHDALVDTLKHLAQSGSVVEIEQAAERPLLIE